MLCIGDTAMLCIGDTAMLCIRGIYRQVVYRGYRHVVYQGYRHVVYRGCTLMATIERITVSYMYTMVNASFMTSYVYELVISTCTHWLMPVT